MDEDPKASEVGLVAQVPTGVFTKKVSCLRGQNISSKLGRKSCTFLSAQGFVSSNVGAVFSGDKNRTGEPSLNGGEGRSKSGRGEIEDLEPDFTLLVL